jgi:hypothetical protein
MAQTSTTTVYRVHCPNCETVRIITSDVDRADLTQRLYNHLTSLGHPNLVVMYHHVAEYVNQAAYAARV